jgi:hypothetical protein
MSSPGNSYLIPNPPHYETEHLYVIIAINTGNKKALIVNLTENKAGKEQGCIINPGEHPFVKKQTTINFAEAKITDIKNLEESVKHGVIKIHAKFEESILKRIQEAALSSPSIPIKCQEFLRSADLK